MATKKTKDLIIEENILEDVIITDSETGQPTVATMRAKITRIWRGKSTEQREESTKKQ